MIPDGPAVCVVIPTYNRAELLRRTLESLAVQDLPEGWLEVVVADDGSTDDTRQVVRAFADRLPTHYYHQEDLGFRAGSARNGGARMTSAAVLAFLDTGVVVGPAFARAHYEAHQTLARQGTGAAVLGYTYGYDLYDPYPRLDWLLAEVGPAGVVDLLGDDPSFRDVRHAAYAKVDFDLGRMLTPWTVCYSVNLSVRAEDFFAIGGFDEDFTGYGFEDMELGFRLAEHGVGLAVSRAAWGLEAPHERDHDANSKPWRRNLARLLDKHRTPAVELCAAINHYQLPTTVEESYRTLVDWSWQASGMDVADELATAAASVAEGSRLAAFGCGGRAPDSWPAAGALIDFDHELLELAAADRPRAPRTHGIGLHTPYPDQAFDLVVVSSRLAGVWHLWGETVLLEARRIGREVRAPLVHLNC